MFIIKRENINSFLVGLFGLIVFRMLLDICYTQIITQRYGYVGFINDVGNANFLYSWLLLIILSPLIIVNYNKNQASSNIIVALSLISFVPTTSLMAQIPMPTNMIVLTTVYWSLLFICNYYSYNIKLTLPRVKSNIFFWLILLLLCFTVIYISGKYARFRLHFNLLDVYGIRMEERGYKIPLVLSYLLSAANSILPLILVYFMHCRKYFLCFVVAFIIFLNFGIGAHKAVLFLLLFSIVAYKLYHFKLVKFFSWFFILFCIIALLESCVFGSETFSAIFVYRLLYIPSYLNYCYYDFFSVHELDYFRQGFLRWFGATSPYEQNIAFLIGKTYFNDASSRANNGLFTDAYFNLGAIGILLFPVLLVFFFKVMDTCTKRLSDKLVIVPVVIASIALLSTTITTALLTGGLLLISLMLYLLPRTDLK